MYVCICLSRRYSIGWSEPIVEQYNDIPSMFTANDCAPRITYEGVRHEGVGYRGETLVWDVGVLKTGWVVHSAASREATEQRRLRIMSRSLALIIPDQPTDRPIRSCVYVCACERVYEYMSEAHISSARLYSPSSRTHRVWLVACNAAYMSNRCVFLYSTGCSGRNLSAIKNDTEMISR